MFGILAVFVQAAAGQIAYLALRLEGGSFPRPLHPAEEQAAFAALQNGDAAARDRLISTPLEWQTIPRPAGGRDSSPL